MAGFPVKMPPTEADNKRAKAREVIDVLEDISKLLVRAVIPSSPSIPTYTAVWGWSLRLMAYMQYTPDRMN